MTEDLSSMGQEVQPKVDFTVPHPARVWNYWLGGKDNFAVDREVGENILAVMPTLVDSARAHRAFLGRAVRLLTAELGVRQFLDIGSGLPAANNTHEVAQAIAPESRVVYVDNDPVVLVHARALLVGTEQGVTDYIQADLRQPHDIVRGAGDMLDFTKPIALMLSGSLNFVPDDQAYPSMEQLIDAVPTGSYVVIAHSTAEVHRDAAIEAVRRWNEQSSARMVLRNREEIGRFLDGMELLDPGVVSCSWWRPYPDDIDAEVEVSQFCAVARKS